ncbi:MAG: TolC family protein, partial [Verrucomicrobiota bacterium]|nr:TolC family protein [Verrucomicrobiota bacterium]
MKQLVYPLLILIGAGLAGCATGPTEPTQAFAGLTWPKEFTSGTTNAPAGTGWLSDFNDRTLDALVRESLSNNPDLRVTAAKLEAAQANLKIAGAPLLPTLSAKAAASRTKRNSTSGFKVTSNRSYRHTPTLDLAWELDVWGRLKDAQFAARLDAEQAAANLQAARLSLAANTAKGWFNLAETELQSQLAKQTLSSYTNNLAVLEEGLQR